MNIDQVKEYVHQHTKDLLDGYLEPAKKHGQWICPICGHGKGGDGLRVDEKRADQGKLHCFTHEFDGDIFNLIGEQYGLDNFMDQVKKTCEIFNISLDDRDNTTRTYTGNTAKIRKIHTHEHEPSPKYANVQKDKEKAVLDVLEGTDTRFKRQIETARANLTHPKAKAYLTERGLTPETAEEFGIGYLNDRTFFETRTRTDNDSKKSYSYDAYISHSLVFPIGFGRMTTRDLTVATKPQGKEKKSDKASGLIDIPFGIERIIRDKDKTRDNYLDLEPVFLVEGQIDAMSLYQAGADAVSLNGKGNIDTVAMIFNHYGIKRPLILALDNDLGERGEKTKEEAIKTLKEAGLEAYSVDLIPQGMRLDNGESVTDANDLLRLDLNSLKHEVDRAKDIQIQSFKNSFNRARQYEFINGIGKSVNAPAIPTGFNMLDSEHFLDGGLYEGLYIIGAISALGKTAFTLQLADQIAEQGHDVLYLSLEMSANELIARSVSRYTKKNFSGFDRMSKNVRDITDGKRYNSYTDQEKNHIFSAMNEYFNDTGDTMRIVEGIGTISADTVRNLVDEHVKHTGKAPVIFIDYLQLMAQPADENGHRHSMTDKQIVDANVMLLKQISRDYKTPVFAISAFNRSNYTNEVSTVSFRESSSIEYSSDVLIGLERQDQPRKGTGDKSIKEYEIEMNRIEQEEINTGIRKVRLKIIKNRNGQAGGKIIFNYHFRYNFFDEVDNEQRLLEAQRDNRVAIG